MLKCILLLGSFIFLQSCGNQEIDDARAEFLCEEHAGLYSRGFIGSRDDMQVVCKDGTELRIPIADFRKVSGPGVVKYLNKVEGNNDES